MCNRQPTPYPYSQATGGARNARAQPAGARRVQAAPDPLMDVHTENPQCEYEQLTEDGVPICVTPRPDEPIYVQPYGPGTPLVDLPQSDETQQLVPGSPMPESLTNYNFVPGFLRAHLGDLVRVEFLVTNATTDRVGVLREVGASYIVLESLDGGSQLMCDLFSIRFVTIMQGSRQDVLAIDTIDASNRFQG